MCKARHDLRYVMRSVTESSGLREATSTEKVYSRGSIGFLYSEVRDEITPVHYTVLKGV
jgi:hypothetical protein